MVPDSYTSIIPSIGLSIFLVCTTPPIKTDELILIKLYTVAVYNLRMFITENNPGLKYFKGDNYVSRMECPL